MRTHPAPASLPTDPGQIQNLVRSLVRAAGGTVTLPEDWYLDGAGVLSEDLNEITRELTIRVTCMDGHEPDDPAPGRAICCRTCGFVIEEGRR